MTKKFVSALLLSLFSFLPAKSFAFHSVTEILPDNKILICKDFNQVRVGNKVEIYSKKLPHSRGGIELVKADELTLPSEGQKVDLYHREFHRIGKRLKYHDEKISSATVISLKLEGKDRKILAKGNSRSSMLSEKNKKISGDEAVVLQKNCIVVSPDNNIKINELSTVVF
ncbi:MAG: hypothetical protein H7281_10985 [Bacteriovorax sp.]|nr:hypothetical protein [Bacteriovorax sp.]